MGRTRYCVHPEARVGDISVVGGTKDWKQEDIERLRPDFLLLDKEENTKAMAEAMGCQVYATHVQSTEDVPRELDVLGGLFGSTRLLELAREWRATLDAPSYPRERVKDLPVIEWIRKPRSEPDVILYLIWRGPWRVVSRHTFVGSMLTHLGYGGRIPSFSDPYPQVDLGDFDPERTLLLFSSEPYPFEHKKRELAGLDFPSALVDGEAFSWFGLRSLRFLQTQAQFAADSDSGSESGSGSGALR